MQPGERSIKSRVLLLIEILALAQVYFFSGTFGLSLAFVHKSASAVWPPTGLALVALLFRGYRLWPAIFVGAFAVNFVTQGSASTSIAIAIGNTLEAVVGAWLVQRFADGVKALERTRNIFRFILLTAMFSTIISSTIGVSSLCLGGYAPWPQFGTIWLTWWLGDMVSDLTIAPFLVIWFSRPVPRLKLMPLIEAVGLIFLVVWVGRAVFLGKTPFQPKDYPLEY